MNGQYNTGDIVLHNWKLVRLIGEGSFGRVYEAEREEFGRVYKAALKIITIPQSQSEIRYVMADGMDEKSASSYFKGIVEELLGEFSIMSKLKGNSNVVSCEDFTVNQHTEGIGWDIIIRMELLTPLIDHAQGKTLTRRDVMQLGIDICHALELCQKANIIHRDIKPDNIFFSEMGEYKLGDFGIARTVEKTTGELSKKGTYTYMAPEIYRGEDYGSSVDIYSLGIVLYRMLNANRTPFLPDYPALIQHGDKEEALRNRFSGAQIPKPKGADGRLAEIVLKACAFNPNERHSSPMQLREELEAILYTKEEAQMIYPHGHAMPLNPNEYAQTPLPRSENEEQNRTEALLAGSGAQDLNAGVIIDATNLDGQKNPGGGGNEALGNQAQHHAYPHSYLAHPGDFGQDYNNLGHSPDAHHVHVKQKRKIPLAAMISSIAVAAVLLVVAIVVLLLPPDASEDAPPVREAFRSKNFITGTTRNAGNSSARRADGTLIDNSELIRDTAKFTFLILGTDGSDTDAIMVATLDTANRTFDVVNIPRDTLVNVSWGVKKANSIHANMRVRHMGEKNAEVNAMESTVEAFADLLGFEVDYWVVVNMQAFIALVDAVGGVDFYVPVNMRYTDEHQGLYINYSQGMHNQLNGIQALEVLRFRAYPNADIGRIGTQQGFLHTAAEQVLSKREHIDLLEFAEIMLTHLVTDIPLNHLVWFAEVFLQLEPENITFHTMPGNYSDSLEGQAYVTVYVDMWLELVNSKLNPFSVEITEDDVSVLTRRNERELYLTSGNRQGNPQWGINASAPRNEVSTTEPQGNASAPPPIEAQSIEVRYGRFGLPGSPDAPEFALRMRDETVTLNVMVEPVGVEDIPQWSTSNADVFEVTPTTPEANEAIVRAIGHGVATLTVTVGNASQDVTVRIS